VAPANAILSGGSHDTLSQMLTGASQWATWVYMALLPFLLIRDRADLRLLLLSAAAAAALVGLVIVVQWFFHDYSYVLDALEYSSYFHRVRGTYYYHAPATFVAALGCMFLLSCLGQMSYRTAGFYLGAIGLSYVVLMNNTRGVSLALVVGAVVVLLLSLRHRKVVLALASLTIVLIVSSNILYLKPISGSTSTVGSADEEVGERAITSRDAGVVQEKDVAPLALEGTEEEGKVIVPPVFDSTEGEGLVSAFSTGETETAAVNEKRSLPPDETKADLDVGEVITANQGRALLFFSGLKYISEVIWTGSGIGTLEIPLPLNGTAFGGINSTYSSHTLYLDIALMAGVPALLFFSIVFALAGLRFGVDALTMKYDGSQLYRTIGLVGVMAIFLAGWLFLPQERNNLIGVGFFVASLSWVNFETAPPEYQRTGMFTKLGFGAVATVVLFWALVTSPSYVFPALEFVARHGREIGRSDAQVGVNDAKIVPLVSTLLRLRGVGDAQVFLLPDRAKEFAKEKLWVLWNPAEDYRYRKLRKELGYQAFRDGGQEPSFKLPRHWWVAPSAQPVVMFLYAGARPEVAVPLDRILGLACSPNVVFSTRLKERLGFSNNPGEGRGTGCNEGHTADVKRRICIDIDPLFADVAKTVDERFTEVCGRNAKLLVSGINDNIESGNVLLTSLPNQSVWSEVTMLGRSIYPAKYVADLNHGTHVNWNSNEDAALVFDLGKSFEGIIGLYRMTGIPSGRSKTGLNWDLAGSDNGANWVLLDRQRGQSISQVASDPSVFFFPNSNSFRYYSITFLADEAENGSVSLVKELELYPLPVKTR